MVSTPSKNVNNIFKLALLWVTVQSRTLHLL